MPESTPAPYPVSSAPGALAEAIQQLKSASRPIALTIEGHTAAILQDPDDYNRLLDLLDQADAREGILRGLADAVAGRTRPAHEVFAELDQEYGLQG